MEGRKGLAICEDNYQVDEIKSENDKEGGTGSFSVISPEDWNTLDSISRAVEKGTGES